MYDPQLEAGASRAKRLISVSAIASEYREMNEHPRETPSGPPQGPRRGAEAVAQREREAHRGVALRGRRWGGEGDRAGRLLARGGAAGELLGRGEDTRRLGRLSRRAGAMARRRGFRPSLYGVQWRPQPLPPQLPRHTGGCGRGDSRDRGRSRAEGDVRI